MKSVSVTANSPMAMRLSRPTATLNEARPKARIAINMSTKLIVRFMEVPSLIGRGCGTSNLRVW